MNKCAYPFGNKNKGRYPYCPTSRYYYKKEFKRLRHLLYQKKFNSTKFLVLDKRDLKIDLIKYNLNLILKRRLFSNYFSMYDYIEMINEDFE